MIVVWRRWHDGVFLAVAVIVEASVFVIVSFIVGRDRPPVVKLDPPAPSGSFPSGHTAAAVAFYAGVFVVVCWHTRNRLVRAVFAVVAVAAPITVGVSRAYRGMHHPIDVIAGLLLGVAALVVVRAAMRAGVRQIDRTADDSVPDRGPAPRPDHAAIPTPLVSSQEAIHDQFHVHRRDRFAQGRGDRPPASRARHVCPPRAGSPRASCTSWSACSPFRSPSTGSRSDGAEGADERGQPVGRRGRRSPRPRSARWPCGSSPSVWPST